MIHSSQSSYNQVYVFKTESPEALGLSYHLHWVISYLVDLISLSWLLTVILAQLFWNVFVLRHKQFWCKGLKSVRTQCCISAIINKLQYQCSFCRQLKTCSQAWICLCCLLVAQVKWLYIMYIQNTDIFTPALQAWTFIDITVHDHQTLSSL